MLKKIRRMLALQGLMWSAALWFGWKNRDAIERSVRAAKAAWNEAGADSASPDEVVVAAIVIPDTPGGEEAVSSRAGAGGLT